VERERWQRLGLSPAPVVAVEWHGVIVRDAVAVWVQRDRAVLADLGDEIVDNDIVAVVEELGIEDREG